MPSQKQATIESRYDERVKTGQIRDDEAQRQVLAALQALSVQLSASSRRKPGSIARLLHMVRWIPASAGMTAIHKPRGIYIWGNVGRGKSMLMDLFFQNAPVAKKRRVHFHAFMQEVHGRIHKLRHDKSYHGDPVATLAKQLAQETSLLCFDELQAADVADATLLWRLFSGLFAADVTIVSTSNHPPASLYTGGVQRERFAKFIALIEGQMQVLALSSSSDYRMVQIKSLQQVYFYPLGVEADNFIEHVIEHLCTDTTPAEDTLSVQGRITRFTVYNHSIGRFTFGQLCESALGPADYIALAKRLDTLILTGIPTLPPEKRNEAKRFVTLIDALYEHKVKLICTASAPPEMLYGDGDGTFEFKRTVSRLAEMQSAQYLKEQP